MEMVIQTIKLRQGTNFKGKISNQAKSTFVPCAFLISQFQKLSVDLIL